MFFTHIAYPNQTAPMNLHTNSCFRSLLQKPPVGDMFVLQMQRTEDAHENRNHPITAS